MTMYSHVRLLASCWLEGHEPPPLPYPLDDAVRLWHEGPDCRPNQALDGVSGLLARRVSEVAGRAARGEARTLAATPTLISGHIEREPDTAAGPADAMQVLLRRPGHAALDMSFSYVGSESEHFYTYARWRRPPIHVVAATAAGEHPPVIAASLANTDYASHPGSWLWEERQPTIAPHGRLGVLWALTAIPHHLDLLLAGAATVAALALELPDTHNLDAILHRACDGDVALRDAAWHAIAVALLSKAPTLQLAAGDLLIAASESNRLDPRGLGGAMAFYADNGIGKLTRVTPAIAAWARGSDECAVDAYETLIAFAASLERGQRALHAPMTLAAELRARLHTSRPSEADAVTITRLAHEVGKSSGLGRALSALLDENPPGHA